MPPERQINAGDERTPLLATADAYPVAGTEEDPNSAHGIISPTTPTTPTTLKDITDDDKPLPWGQISLLCFSRLVEPIAFFTIFPFINQMIWETGKLKKEDVGFYSGLIESLFSLTQMIFMIPFGRAADRFGRKPILIISLLGVSFATGVFGFSTSLWQMIVFRCIGGAFAGIVVTVRAMITENSTSKTQARAFSFFAFTGNMGIFFGPLIGGALAEPARQYPKLFGSVKLFIDFPYALPTLASASIGFIAVLTTTFFVKETLVREKTDENNPHPTKPMSTSEMIASPGVKMVLLIYGYVMMIAFAFTAVLPVFWFEPIEYGGFGFKPYQFSIFLGIGGLAQSFWSLVVFTPLHHRIGTRGILKLTAISMPIAYSMYPIFNLWLRGHGWSLPAFILLGILSVVGAGAAMGFTGVQLALNDVSPSPAVLGTLNAVALAMTSGIRACTPASATPIYALGVRNQILAGQLIWLILVSLAIGYSTIVWTSFPKEADSKMQPTMSTSAEEENTVTAGQDE